MNDIEVISCCGMICSACQYYPNDCEGCSTIKGQAFWLEFTGEKVCDIYKCCVNQKKVKHCGNCSELPCERFMRGDPTKTQEENEKDLQSQLSQLNRMCEE